MDNKHILLVDDERAILTVLKNSLTKLGPNYHIITAQDGLAALGELQDRQFDLVVTDYDMAHMDGLEFIEAVRYIDPATRVILMTSCSNELVEAEARRLQVYRYLTKPLDIDAFRRIVQDALSERTVTQPHNSVSIEEQYRQINRLLEQLRKDVGARCLFLANVQGHIITRLGDTGQIPMGELASLLGAGTAPLKESGRILDESWNATSLIYREGKKEHLYALDIDQILLLIAVIPRGPYSSRLGTVWYYAQQVAIDIRQVLNEINQASPEQIFD